MANEQPRNALVPGTMVHWYRIVHVLGKGGFGITYLAHDTNLDKQVAIKEYLPADIAVRGDDGDIQPITTVDAENLRWGREGFITEARTLTKFDHENIVRVYSVFEAHQTAYIVMRYEQGRALSEILEARRTLPERELYAILRPLLDGLKQVHRAGFVHRDVQPANIYIRDDGSPVLLDFGAARPSAGRHHTVTILVAPGYAPIEQYYSNGDDLGAWTDIYGLAATAYRAIAGVAPIDAIERSRGILGSTRDVLVPAVLAGAQRYSNELLAAIDHGLKFNARERPQTVEQWERELFQHAATAKLAVVEDEGADSAVSEDGGIPKVDADEHLAVPKSGLVIPARCRARLPLSRRSLFIVVHVVFAIIATARACGLFEALELHVYDRLLARTVSSGVAASPISLVEIDEQDIHRFGWPLSDEVLADLLTTLESNHAGVIGVDLYRDLPVGDGAARLHEVLSRYSNIVGIERFAGPRSAPVSAPSALIARDQYGFADIILDDDGVVRRALLFMNDADRVAVSFPLRLATLYLEKIGISPEHDSKHTTLMRLGATTFIPFEHDDGAYSGADARGYQFFMDYGAARIPNATCSLAAVIDGNCRQRELKNGIVLIDVRAESVNDYFLAPPALFPAAQNRLTGAAIHASTVDQIVRVAQGQSRLRRGVREPLQMAILWVLCLTSGWSVNGIRGAMLGPVAASFCVGTVIVAVLAFELGWWLPIVTMTVAVALSTLSVSALRWAPANQ